jgi:hypothetical protein
MGEVFDMHGQPAHLEDDLEFVADCCRYAENILSEAAVKKNTASTTLLGRNSAATTRSSRLLKRRK